MAGVWRNAMSYLGLGPDEDYDDFEPEREPVDSAPPRPQRVRPQGPPPEGQPVIVNLEAADRDLSRRLIDFASGVCYGLGGTMERVGGQVYLLTPTDVEVSDDDKRRLTQRGGS